MTHVHRPDTAHGRRRRGRRGVIRNAPLRTHWLLLSVLVVTLCGALLIQGYTQHVAHIGNDATQADGGPAGGVPAVVGPRRPVIDPTREPRHRGPAPSP
jgi:hypothetical protein